jgi:hypothetical protein
LILPLRLGAFARDNPNSCFPFFARDHPKLTGARSSPYENLRVLRAFVVKMFLIFWLGLCRARFFAVKLSESESLYFVTFVLFVVKPPLRFGCGFAALGPLWLNHSA